MAKTSRGGKAGATLTRGQVFPGTRFPNSTNLFMGQQQAAQPTPQPAPPVQQPTPQPVAQNAPSPAFDAFKKMTDDQKADVITQAAKTPVPVFLAQNDLQKVLYGLKLNDKPTLVDDSVLDTMPGKNLFRNVNATSDAANRMKFSADEIGAQIIKGSVTRVSDTGGSAYGRGIYFADSYSESGYYGRTSGNVKQTAVVRAKLSPSAKTISVSNAQAGVQREISSGSKLGQALTKIGHTDRTAIWSLAKGYDAMVAPNGYHVIINRSALVASKSIKAKGSKW